MIYLVQVTLYTAALYAVYLLFLKNRTAHNWSRAYLLMNMVVPIVLPFIRIPSFNTVTDVGAEVMLPVVTVGQQVSEKVDSIAVLPILYLAVCFTMLGYFIVQLMQVVLFIKRQQKEKAGDIYLLRNTAKGPGSWFNYVFLPTEEIDELILQHERAHVRLKHSYDVIFLSLLRCLFWPNVLLWVIGKELKTVHEFQADAYAGGDREAYSNKLLAEMFHTKHFSVSHTFFHNPIKRRIMMLRKTRSTFGRIPAITVALLLIAGVLYAQTKKTSNTKQPTAEQKKPLPYKDQTKPYRQDKKVTNAHAASPQKANAAGWEKKQKEKGTHEPEIFAFVDQMPEFEGDLAAFLGSNIKYPKEALDKKIEGRVTVKFVIDEQGNAVDARVVRSPDELLSKAALDVINKMPKWKPGAQNEKNVKVYFMLPILFKLPSEAAPDESKPVK